MQAIKHKKNMTCGFGKACRGFGKACPGLGQAQKCNRVKLVNRTLPSLVNVILSMDFHSLFNSVSKSSLLKIM